MTKNKDTLIIHIEFNDKLSLVALGRAIESVGEYYCNFSNREATLAIETIEKGSIIFSLVSAVTPAVLQLVSSTTTIIDFAKQMKLLLDYLSGKSNEKPKDANPLNIESLVNLTNSGMSGCNIIINTYAISKNAPEEKIAEGKLSYLDYPVAEDKLKSYRNDQNQKLSKEFKRELFVWHQANFDQNKKGNKGIIQDIYQKPLGVQFVSDEIKSQMTSEPSWQHIIYSVDGIVQYANDEPKMYKITAVHIDDSIYPDSNKN